MENEIPKVPNLTIIVIPLPPKKDTNFVAEGNRFLSIEIPELNTQIITTINGLNTTIDAINDAVADMNIKVDIVKDYQLNAKASADAAKASESQAQVYQVGAENAYNDTFALIRDLVIPTEATYNKEYIDDIETREFLNFKLGED